MAGKFSDRADFYVPESMCDFHEWVCDFLIDGWIGTNCKIIYPPKQTACDNCIQDAITGLSTNIYKTGGPIVFSNYTLCPRCDGIGKLYDSEEETIRARVYYNSRDFVSPVNWQIDARMTADKHIVQIVTYMENLPKLERAIELIIDDQVRGYREYKCQPYSAPIPHGFRRNRYVIQYWQRAGG